MQVENIARLAADGLMKFWRASLLEQWPPLEREVTEQVDACGARLAAGGVEALFASLAPAIHWTGTRLLVRKPHESHVHMENQELVVIPSRLTAHRLIAQVDAPDDASIAFLVNSPLTNDPMGSRNRRSLLGRGRTAVLTALSTPATTRQLALALTLSESTVSHHLQALVTAGLASRQREGRQVAYSLTQLGHRLQASIH